MTILTSVLVSLFGLAAGSFLNVCIARIPRREPLFKGRPRCSACGAPIPPHGLVPVLGFLLLRGRCRDCGARRSPQEPFVELLNAAFWLAEFWLAGLSPAYVCGMLIGSALLAAAMIDRAYRIIPNRIVLFILAAGLLGFLCGGGPSFAERVVGFFAVSLPMLVLCVAFGGFGEGDVKLMAVCGFALGWKLTVFAFLVSSVAGSLYGLVLILRKKATRRSEIPFGPWLALGLGTAILFGGRIISAYLRSIGLS